MYMPLTSESATSALSRFTKQVGSRRQSGSERKRLRWAAAPRLDFDHPAAGRASASGAPSPRARNGHAPKWLSLHGHETSARREPREGAHRSHRRRRCAVPAGHGGRAARPGSRGHRSGGRPAAIGALETGQPIDVVFSDVQMPGPMDGFSLAAWIWLRCPSVKVILTSAYHQGRSGAELDRATMFVGKPYQVEQVASQILEKLKAAA